MRYAIYGINRVSKDFRYIFDKLDIVFYLEDSPDKEMWNGIPVKKVEQFINEKNHIQIIICDYDHMNKEKRLDALGLKYGRDFVYEEDFFDRLDEVNLNPNNKPIYVWGTGIRSKKLDSWAKEINYNIDIQGYIDTYKGGNRNLYHDINVFSPDEIEYQDVFIIVAVARYAEIEDKLKEKGLKEYKDYCISTDFINRPSMMLRQTLFDRNSYNFDCKTMLNHAEILNDGDMICCCSTFISNTLGRLTTENTPGILWDSNIHKIMSLSNVNHTYSFCNKNMCPLFIGRNNNEEVDIDKPYEMMKKRPSTVALGYDKTCNLYCITCRDELCVEKGKRLEGKIELSEKINQDIIPECEFLILAGDGEVFLSQVYKKIYTSAAIRNIKYLRLLTNGILFNKRKWDELRKYTDARIMMTVSIDAATKETYETIRRGGDFDILQRNMEYAASLRKNGDLSYLRFNFVVQAKNYLEMPKFVEWGLSLGVDEIFFTKILNWGTYSEEEFKKISMMKEDGITPKLELENVLNDPIMSNSIVDLGTIRSHHERYNVDVIDNYYRWELERKVEGLFADGN